MKKLFTFMLVAAFAMTLSAQTPRKMSYQAVVRNPSGELIISQAIGMKISILLGSATGTVVYSETYSPDPQTNTNGLVTVEIGSGTPVTGSFTGINWAGGPYYLKTEIDPDGGTGYTIIGTSQLLSVPYALYAVSAENVFSGNYNDLTNKPLLFSGSYNDLTNKPLLFDGTWSSLTGKPVFAAVATSGSFNDLLNRPTLFSGAWADLTGTPTTLAGYGITDADGSITNELQTLSLSGTLLTLSNGGGTVTLPTSGEGGDNWGIQTVVSNSTLTGEGTTASPLAVANSVITPLWSNIQSIPAGFSDGIDNVDDADNSITNEIQVLSLSGTDLTLSNGGGSVTLPSSEGGDNWGTDFVHTDVTLEGQGTIAAPLKMAQQSASTGQVLKWNGTSWTPASDESGEGGSSPFTSSGGITSNSPITDNFVVGSYSLNDISGTNDDARMFFNKTKSAFRAGKADADQWDDSNVGTNSIAFGTGTIASGDYSTAMGLRTKATGGWSTAMGYNSEASGSYAFAAGQSIASENYCTALGFSTEASGRVSTALGANTIAPSGYETAIGRYNTKYTIGSKLGWSETDRLFVIGNGVADDQRSNALVMLKNGNTGFGVDNPTHKLEINGGNTTDMKFFSSASGTGDTDGFMIGTRSTPHNAYIWNYENTELCLATNNQLRMIISGDGNISIGNHTPSCKLDVGGQIKISGGSPGAGKVLTSDTDGLASWETSGALTLPFRGGSSCEECEVFYIHNTERGTAIKGDSYLGHGIVGETRGTDSYVGVLGYASNNSGVSIGVKGNTNSLTGYSGYFTGGRFYVNGNVGIGNNSPSNALSVAGQADISERLVVGGSALNGRLLVANADGAGNSLKVGSSAGDNANMYFLTNGLIFDCYRASDARRQPILLQPNGGRVGIGTTTPTQVLHVVGNAYKTEGGTSWATSSDLRLKTLLGNYDKGLEEIVALQPVRFVYMENNPRSLSSDIEQVGFVAQEVEKIFPEAVSEAEDGFLDFNIHSVNVALVNAVKELKAENDKLKSENEQINSRLARLEKILSAVSLK